MDNIYNLIISYLTENNLWFTTKNDLTYEEADFYYELDKYGNPTEESISRICKEVNSLIGDGAVNITDAIELWSQEALSKFTISYADNLITEFEPEPVVNNIEAFSKPKKSSILNEDKLIEGKSIKTRLEEENTNSLNLISDKLSADDFDEDSKAGQIVLRTSQLFNVLSEKGYILDVSFDNGESQTTIRLQQGGQINITIRDENEDLKAFLSGNLLIDDDLINTLTNVINLIKDI